MSKNKKKSPAVEQAGRHYAAMSEIEQRVAVDILECLVTTRLEYAEIRTILDFVSDTIDTLQDEATNEEG